MEPSELVETILPSARLVTLAFDASSTTCASLELNGVPCVRAVLVTTTSRLVGCVLRVSIHGEQAHAWSRPLETLEANSTLAIDAAGFLLPIPLLCGSTERAHVDLVATLADSDGLAIAAVMHRLTLVPSSHWCGVSNAAESLAAFVTPNAPALAEVLRDASARLLARTQRGALDGYLSNSPERAQRLAEACFEALAARGIAYAILQASFETEGQKIRTATDALQDRLANCLDLSVTLAAMLEACGLWTMILAGDGHATVAFATIDSHFPDTTHRGRARAETRRALGELRVIEATALCDAEYSFAAALEKGEAWLASASEDIWVIDIRASRRAGFHPLPEVIERRTHTSETNGEAPLKEWTVVQPTGLPPLPKAVLSPREQRLEQWKKKLLDLTLRNRLLNDRAAAGIPLLAQGDGEIALLEDLLWNEKAFTLKSRGAMRVMTAEAIREELNDRILRSALDDAELFKRATKTFRDAKSSLEETGARSLYVAIGFLEYTVEQRSAPILAPILLVPVTLERISRAEGFRVRAVSEDTVVNAALVEYLRTAHTLDVGLSGVITEDDKGVDVPALLARVRQAVRNIPGALVHAHAKLGNYSFKKLPLFEEMRSRGKVLTNHDILASLLDRSASVHVRGARLLEPEQVDTDAPFATLRLPLAADSSQIAAICSATAGRSFVLQGPPGTGKSQTITNLLAECLARGKRVLFIAEKGAALEVVSERLRKAGLGSFALDLHADNATKTSFVAQVKRSFDELDARAAPGSQQFGALASALDRTRARLKASCDALHAEHHDGPSASDAVNRATSLRESATHVKDSATSALAQALEGVLPAQLSRADLVRRLEATANLAAAAAELPTDAAARLHDFSPTSALNPEQASAVGRDALAALTQYEALSTAATALTSALGLSAPATLGELARLTDFACAIDAESVAAATLAQAAFATDHTARIDALARAIELGARAEEATKSLDNRYDRSVLALELTAMVGDLRAVRERFVVFRWLATRKARAQLLRAAKGTAPSGLDALLTELESLIITKDRITEGQSVERETRLFATSDGHIDWVAAQKSVQRARETGRATRVLLGSHLAALAAAVPVTIASGALTHAREGAAIALAATRKAFEAIDRVAVSTPPLNDAASTLRDNITRLRRLHESAGLLAPWSVFTTAREGAHACGLAPVATALLDCTLSPHTAERVVEAELLSSWVRDRLRNEPPLADCATERARDLTQSFVDCAADYRKGAAGAVAAVVRTRAREFFDNAHRDSISRAADARLQELRALTTIRRPIRRVMAESALAINALMPIVLASPLSATTHIPPDFPVFDLVVFDEASQVPVWDAACAIARGVTTVIVGDSKQLPPTNFFDRKDSGDDADDAASSEAQLADALEPLESVLEEAIASGFPQRSLLWHYRSRDERLIEFSNRRSYGGRLQTFPAPHRAHPNLGVEFRFVGGVYDRAKTSTNRMEAEAIVAEITRRLLDNDACSANRSIGVVTFSVAQQTLVQDLLDEALDANALLRERYAGAETSGDEVFIKNLENVQGDERSTMLFSICYGRDASGSLYHNFGPLNLSGGERRLNVAVTRAKEKVIIFSSIRATDLDPSKCNARGLQDLRDYLAFAELGTIPTARSEGATAVDIDVSAIELMLARALELRGWRVDFHVGRSRDYRVGLALSKPDEPQRWILGVEVDGAFHLAAPTVIDRDIVRPGVLSGLGWKTMRVSAIDVLRDATKVVDRIDAAARA